MRRRFDMLLTPRENRLLRRFAQGRTDRSIARELCEPVERIAAQRERLLEKLQIRSMDHLTEAAVRLASRGFEKLRPPKKEDGAAASVTEGDAIEASAAVCGPADPDH
jgi:DNA-binding CsgD family transcriptional regulator